MVHMVRSVFTRRRCLLMVCIAVCCVLTACDDLFESDEYDEDYFADEYDEEVEDEMRDAQVSCSREEIWRGPRGDVQFFSICQGACLYQNPGYPAHAVETTCRQLGEYRDSCIVCD